MSERTLFIGGCADGQWRLTDGQPYVRVARRHAGPALDRVPGADFAEVRIWHDEYRRASASGIAVYIETKLTLEDAVARLVEHYPSKWRNHLMANGEHRVTVVFQPPNRAQ